MQFATIFSFVAIVGFVAASPLAASPLTARANCQCAVCDVGAGDCKGDDLKDYNACVAVVLGECGRSCMDLAAGTGAQDGCLAAEITRQKPCENKCVQARLKAAVPPSKN